MKLTGRRERDSEGLTNTASPDLVDHLADAVIVVDASSQIMRINPAALRLFGYLDAVRPNHLDQLLPPDRAEAHRANVAAYSQTDDASSEMGTRAPVTARRSDGSTFPAQVSLTNYSPAPGVGWCAAVVRDLGEWRRLERANEELQYLVTGILESTQTELAIVDEHLMIVTANSSFRRQFMGGADPTGMSLSELAGTISDTSMLDILQAVRDAVE
ncbi:MAG: PAS domain S-box protein, partial [Actinomycetota bacterium]